MGLGNHRSIFSGRRALAGAAVLACLIVVPVASAHIERAAYWPDPAAETVGGVPAGGAVPKARGLFKALAKKPVGVTRVVCQGGSAPKKPKGQSMRRKYAKALRKHPSIKRLAKSIKKATGSKPRNPKRKAAKNAKKRKKGKKGKGYVLRPSEPNVKVSRKFAWRLYKFNIALLKRCKYSEIQPAVTDSGNNDRVVVMPGIYTEPTSRAAPTNDPRCDGLKEVNDRPGDGAGGYQTGALSYAYQATCPNDQNLIMIVGREPRPDQVPATPLEERRGIPDNGPCLRCNLQMEGSGLSPEDVTVDAGRVASGNKGPAEPAKHNGIRADRADGFVLRNITVRHAQENGVYAPEIDGYRMERLKTFYNEDYGVLTYTADHGLIQDCDAAGSGDAGLYPGAAADTGQQTNEPGGPRYNQQIRRCDMHHNSAGYSGTAGNAVWINNNDFYDNALGFTTDVFTAAGHPGFPQDSDLIENNEFYGNNFNPYLPSCPSANYEKGKCSDIDPTIPVPVGTGLWIAGGNNNTLRNNRFWDNWRRGVMLFAVPDAFVCGNNPVAGGNQQAGCQEGQISTSFDNKFYDNQMSRSPQGAPDPNGVDFWWDQFAGNTGNCWYRNVGKDGTRGTLTADPPPPPAEGGASIPGTLPSDCATSAGTLNPPQESELLSCFAVFDQGAPAPCTWFTTPPEPQP